jgi:hypothetical protein
MCLLLTLLAAAVSTILWKSGAAKPAWKMGTLSLMYWGASLMWTVDGISRVADGESFFEMTADDALLGLLIVACGIAGWLLTLWVAHSKAARVAARHANA